MRPTPRITRGFYSRVPRWSTNYPQPFNWSLVELLDAVPLVVVLLLVDAYSGWFIPLLALSVLWFGVRFVHRLRTRAEYCEEHGHDPYRPVPEVAEYRCRFCDQWIDVGERDVAEAVQAAADEIGRARFGERTVPQARWSNRR